ncbi:pyridine nucleotide-disulfide oxidoreductase [Nocardioides gansuensis]|uniref:Pyridine nucleotide-disulfide oxidoreductase n=1 Tax=Nocardioides gansuensis TaxID=2138300 RepID=A0A2T8FDY9_9ACTN|nr:FAD/NAD(P)-binding protein [Nocardioides gansuensis]PVG83913.1 pyridine nucleotide-disulfide oxidoreductase [Nocardioides gansuensis]
MVEVVEADYLVVGAGAAGMAFTDALIDHADVTVALVDRRHGAGGHWLDAYPFVRLHQASAFYGVASTLLGGGQVQQVGPEAGLHERATAPEICAYYARVLSERLLASGRVAFHPGCSYLGAGLFVSRISGRRYEVSDRTRIVDARYLSPQIPSGTPAPFGVVDGVDVIPVNDLVRLEASPSQYVVIGAGKTATDACIWLLGNGVDPDAIRWVRPREPWMLNRAVVQPDPAVFIGMAADTLGAATRSVSADDLFLRLEEAGIMLRIDRSVTPAMAKAPTLAEWELDRLRTLENVVRLGHIRHVEPTRLVLDEGDAPIARDAVLVHCAAPGLRYRPLVPIWASEAITLQPIRSGFPCFGAALAGFVEATFDEDEEKNRLCPPSPYSNTPPGWARMQVLGARSAMSFGSNADIKAWANGVALNPARIPPQLAGSPQLTAAMERFRGNLDRGLARMAELAGMS